MYRDCAGTSEVHRPQFSQRAAAGAHPLAGPDRSPPAHMVRNNPTKLKKNLKPQKLMIVKIVTTEFSGPDSSRARQDKCVTNLAVCSKLLYVQRKS
jgi:hypothetical protein